jgi:SAM-dependent methyltransferase
MRAWQNADAAMISISSRTGLFRRAFRDLRTEGGGAVREAFAVGIGVFIGCAPVYGFHLLLCWGIGWALGLNRLKMYLAANISNPFVAPFLILGELEAGAWLRRGAFHALSLETVRNIDPWSFGADLIVGSVAVGGVLGVLTGGATYALARAGKDDEWFAALVRRASDRYIASSVTAWEFARGKLRGDPLYRTVLAGGVLPAGGTLVDVGCGQGLMLATIVEAADAGRLPPFEQLVGIELRPRIAAIAREALGDRAAIVEGDARTHLPPLCRTALFFDVLHMVPAADQEALLASAARTLEPGGVILIREPDAAAGWRFRAVHLGNRLKALAGRNWRQTFHFRTAADWTALAGRQGFRVEARGTGDGTPFANVLFVLRK